MSARPATRTARVGGSSQSSGPLRYNGGRPDVFGGTIVPVRAHARWVGSYSWTRLPQHPARPSRALS